MQMYVFIYYWELITQNIDKYFPESLTGTAFSIKKYAQIITWQTAAQQTITAVSVSVWGQRSRDPFEMAMPVFPRQNVA